MARPAPFRSASRALLAAAVAAASAAPSAPASAQSTAPTVERGRALYETRCIACHDRSVHRRESRLAQDFAALRREVARWSGNAGGEWRAEEIDAVTLYLNDRYYRFACPPALCPERPRAGTPRGGA